MEVEVTFLTSGSEGGTPPREEEGQLEGSGGSEGILSTDSCQGGKEIANSAACMAHQPRFTPLVLCKCSSTRSHKPPESSPAVLLF